MTDKVYSTTNERYMDLESLMDELRDYHAPGETVTVYEGIPVRYEHKDFVNIDRFFDDMMDNAYDKAGEYADSYLSGVGGDIQQRLEQHIVDFLNGNVRKPEFFTVKDVREVEITIDD